MNGLGVLKKTNPILFPLEPLSTNPNTQFQIVRVMDIIMDENHPQFNELGGFSSIGTVIYQNLNSSINESKDNYNYASPINANISGYPLVNELILIFDLTIDGNNSNNKSKKYYLCSLNLWNTPHHNALPNISKDLNNHIDNKGNIILNLTSEHYEGEFNEKNNINSIPKFPGDYIIEGRNGNSIRLGSTWRSDKNTWSREGENGDPIMIVRNNLSKENNESWIPLSESINTDDSIIFITSTQQIPIKTTSNFISLYEQPIEPNIYSEPQIILNSSRLLLNSKKDGVLINGHKFIHLNSINEIGLNSNKNITLNSRNINLGGIDAYEHSPLGNSLMNALSNLTNTLSNLMDILSELKEYPGGVATPSPLGGVIDILKPEVDSLKVLFDSNELLSKTVKII